MIKVGQIYKIDNDDIGIVYNYDEKYCFNNVYHKNDINVLTPVPSYEETTKLKERLRKTQELELEVRRENAHLKELLKECRPYIGYDTYEFDEKVNKLLTKIDEALK